MKKISKLLFSLIALSLIVFPMAVSAASTTLDDFGVASTSDLKLSDKDPIAIATGLINTAMSFLGLIAVVIFLVGGFKWMTAMGNEENVKKAKELMAAGVIGLVIILSAWGITTFVLGKLLSAGA
ncbi:MAG: pilin [Patescibacteria group bacterium]